MKRFSLFILSVLILSASVNSFSESEKADTRQWLAVHDFTVSEQLEEKGINGWKVAERIEGALAQNGMYRIVTRAKIAKVLKEKNITSSSNIDASAMGGMIGADYIVTGSVTNSGDKITLSAKLIDVKKEAGEIEKSYDVSTSGDTLDDAIKKLPELYDEIAVKMTMTPGKLFDESLRNLDSQNYTEAAREFRDLKQQVPGDEIRNLVRANKDVPPTNDPTLTTPGQLLDYALRMMDKGNSYEAASALNKIITFKKCKKHNRNRFFDYGSRTSRT